METLKTHSMTPFSTKTFRPNNQIFTFRVSCHGLFRLFCASSPPNSLSKDALASPRKGRVRGSAGAKANVKVSDAQLKENWLASLSCPFPSPFHAEPEKRNAKSYWVVGVDPDICGAVALLKNDDDSGSYSAQVYDSPHLQVLIGKRVRKRLDTKSIVRLLRSFDAPLGTTAYIEQSMPYPQDGKQGWWSGGFGYGLWIGALVALGFSVIPVPSSMWKTEFQLSGNGSTKDDSRRVASTLFPSLKSQLTRKKDHGRAEALLIAAYGKGLKTKHPSHISEESMLSPTSLLPSSVASTHFCHNEIPNS